MHTKCHKIGITVSEELQTNIVTREFYTLDNPNIEYLSKQPNPGAKTSFYKPFGIRTRNVKQKRFVNHECENRRLLIDAPHGIEPRTRRERLSYCNH